MKILGISGSPRNKNTDYMIQKVIDGSGLDGEIVFLRDLQISPCNACRICKGELKCHMKDGMEKLYDKIIEADIIVLGSPTYFDNVSGIMKNFMDRCLPFYFSKKLKNKKVILLAVGNFKEDLEFDENGVCRWHKEERASVLKCLDAMRSFCKILEMKIIGEEYALHEDAHQKDKELVNLGKSIGNL